jgi:hypothetical protein
LATGEIRFCSEVPDDPAEVVLVAADANRVAR